MSSCSRSYTHINTHACMYASCLISDKITSRLRHIFPKPTYHICILLLPPSMGSSNTRTKRPYRVKIDRHRRQCSNVLLYNSI